MFPKVEQLRKECYLAKIDLLDQNLLNLIENEANRIYLTLYQDFVQKNEMNLSKLVTSNNLSKSFSSITTTNAIVSNWIQLNWSIDLKNALYDFIIDTQRLKQYDGQYLIPVSQIKEQTKYLVYQDVNTIDQFDSYLCIYVLSLINNCTNLLNRYVPKTQDINMSASQNQKSQQEIKYDKQQQIIDTLSTKLYQVKQECQQQKDQILNLENENDKLNMINSKLLQQSAIQSGQMRNIEQEKQISINHIVKQAQDHYQDQRKAFEFQIQQLKIQLKDANQLLQQFQSENKQLKNQIQQHNVNSQINYSSQSYYQESVNNKYDQFINSRSQISYPLSMTMPPISTIQVNENKDLVIQQLRQLVLQLQNKNRDQQSEIDSLKLQLQNQQQQQVSQKQNVNQDLNAINRQLQSQVLYLQEQLNAAQINYNQKINRQASIIDQQAEQARQLKEQIVNQNIKIKQLREKIKQQSPQFYNEVYAKTIEDLQNHIIRLNRDARNMVTENQHLSLERDKMQNELIEIKMNQADFNKDLKAQNITLAQMNEGLINQLQSFTKSNQTATQDQTFETASQKSVKSVKSQKVIQQQVQEQQAKQMKSQSQISIARSQKSQQVQPQQPQIQQLTQQQVQEQVQQIINEPQEQTQEEQQKEEPSQVPEQIFTQGIYPIQIPSSQNTQEEQISSQQLQTPQLLNQQEQIQSQPQVEEKPLETQDLQ